MKVKSSAMVDHKCRKCGNEYTTQMMGGKCPKCGSPEVSNFIWHKVRE